MNEAEYIESTLHSLRNNLSLIPTKYAETKRQVQKQIDALCEEAGVLTEIERLKESLEDAQRKLQAQADSIQGQVRALETLYTKFHLAPIPEDQPIMYGIDLATLDPETRLRVMHGQEDPTWRETITALGGDPDFREWDGTYEEDEEEEVEEEEDQAKEEAMKDEIEEAFENHGLSPERLMDLWNNEVEEDEDPPEEEEDEDPLFAELERLEQKVEEGRGTKEDLAYLGDLAQRLNDGE